MGHMIWVRKDKYVFEKQNDCSSKPQIACLFGLVLEFGGSFFGLTINSQHFSKGMPCCKFTVSALIMASAINFFGDVTRNKVKLLHFSKLK